MENYRFVHSLQIIQSFFLSIVEMPGNRNRVISFIVDTCYGCQMTSPFLISMLNGRRLVRFIQNHRPHSGRIEYEKRNVLSILKLNFSLTVCVNDTLVHTTHTPRITFFLMILDLYRASHVKSLRIFAKSFSELE